MSTGATTQLNDVLQDVLVTSGAARSVPRFEEREVTVLMADLRGFTAMSVSHPKDAVLQMLNRHLSVMSRIAVEHLGTIDKFIGDGIMVLFGAPVARTDDVRRAVACAVRMQIAMDDLNREHHRCGLPDMFLGIGINTGRMMAGLLGSEFHSEYTVIGEEVNIAARIETFSLRGQILVSQRTRERCGDFAAVREPMEIYFKGRSAPLRIYEVLALPSLHETVPRRETRHSPRVRVHVPFSWQTVRNKVVMPEVSCGHVLDLSYAGAFAATSCPLEPHSDLKLCLQLPPRGEAVAEVYARVIRTHGANGRFLSGLEFTSANLESTTTIKQFVQLSIQGGNAS